MTQERFDRIFDRTVSCVLNGFLAAVVLIVGLAS